MNVNILFLSESYYSNLPYSLKVHTSHSLHMNLPH